MYELNQVYYSPNEGGGSPAEEREDVNTRLRVKFLNALVEGYERGVDVFGSRREDDWAFGTRGPKKGESDLKKIIAENSQSD